MKDKVNLDHLQKLVKLACQVNHSLQSFKGPDADALKKEAMKQTKKALKLLQKAIRHGTWEGGTAAAWPKELVVKWVEDDEDDEAAEPRGAGADADDDGAGGA